MRNSPLRAFAKKNKKTHSTQSDTPKKEKWETYYPNTLIDPNEKSYEERMYEKAKKMRRKKK
jgi:hypothetical protein